MARGALGGKRVRKRVIFNMPKRGVFGGSKKAVLGGFLGVLRGTPKKVEFGPKTRVLDPPGRGGPGPGFDRFWGVLGGIPPLPRDTPILTPPTPGDRGVTLGSTPGPGGGTPVRWGYPTGGGGIQDPEGLTWSPGVDQSYPTKGLKPSRPWSRTNGGWPDDHDRRGDLGSETSC